MRNFQLIALLALGVAMWMHWGAIEFVYGVQRRGLVVAAALGVFVLIQPRPARALKRWLIRHRRFRPAVRISVMAALFLVSTGFVLLVNIVQESDLRPSMCDEYSYLAQSGMLLHGRLWSSAHPHPDFFTTFQFIATPVYGSIYFPGTALWLLPWTAIDTQGGWAWIGSLLAMGLSVAVGYRIAAELLNDWLALVTVLIVICTPAFRSAGMMLMGQAPATMFGLLVVYAYLRWRTVADAPNPRPALLWGLAAGFCVAWGMFCRPVDVLAYSVPVLLLVAFARRVPARRRAFCIGAAMVGAIPLALIQLPFNEAVTGSYLQTPFSWYAQTYLPGTGYGLSEREVRPGPNITAHFRLSYYTFTKPFIDHANTATLAEVLFSRLRLFCLTTVPHGMMLILVPAALPLLLRRPKLWLLAAVFPLTVLLYLPYGFLLGQYAVPSTPPMAFLIVCGACSAMRVIGRLYGERIGAAVSVFCVVGLLALPTNGLPGIGSAGREDWYHVPELRLIDRHLAELPGAGLVFISPPEATGPIEAEPVYNLGVGHPDEARVVRAHDLGARNVELVAYYAKIQPRREVYHLDRAAGTLERLGNVADLAELPEADLGDRFAQRARGWQQAYARAMQVYDVEVGAADD